MRQSSSSILAFATDKTGSVMLMFALASGVLFVALGLAIDSARYYNVSDKIQFSLDAAALAGAKLLDDESQSDGDITKIARNFYDATMIKNKITSTLLAPIGVKIDRADSSVTATAKVSVKSFFGGFANLKANVLINRSSRVVYDMKRVELAMVLDVTGSMLQNNKLGALKTAASDILDELFADAANDTSVRVALAPYSASVNAGNLAGAVADQSHAIDTCVIERTGLAAATDAAPSGGNKLANITTLPYGRYSCPPSTVFPMVGKSKIDALRSAINGYTAVGGTAGHIGTAWGWYLLSPDWSGYFPKESKPEPYSNDKVNKSMIVMTDGLFNTSYQSGSSTADAVQIEESYKQFRALCNGAKDKGITIYTIGFDLSDARAVDELESCASGSAMFFDAKTGADLKSAFREIATNLNTLRVSG